MTALEWIAQGALLILLGISAPLLLRLERRLRELRGDRAVLAEGVAGFDAAAQEAQAALARLRGLADGAGKHLAEKVATAEPLRDDLRFLVERAETLADQLEVLVRQARAASAEGAVPPSGPAPDLRSQAERDLLQALRLAR